MVWERVSVAEKNDEYIATADAMRQSLFTQQRAALEDPSTRKAVLCPRRAGKSWTAMTFAFYTCLKQAESAVVLCLLTLKHAKQVYWKHMQRFARRWGLAVDWHKQDMTVKFENGSTIMMMGAESSEHIDKLRGDSYDLVVIDECKSFHPDVLNELVTEVVEPALDDRSGTLLMIGTPGNVLNGMFYWATADYHEVEHPTDVDRKMPIARTYLSPEQYWTDHPEDVPLAWSRHTWTKQDNIHLPKLWEQALLTKARNRWGDDHPTWMRESLAKWVPSHGSYVYRYGEVQARQGGNSLVNWIPNGAGPHGLPEGHDWRFICGLDLGFEDDFAIVVAAYSLTDGNLYHVYDWKRNHQDFFQMADEIGAVLKRFGTFDAMVGDTGSGGAKTLIETLNKHYGYFIQAAEKREKFDYIEILNGEFLSGRVKVIPKSGLDLELKCLQWLIDDDEDKALLARTGKLKENPHQPNHLCDAFLYLWRFSHHTWGKPRDVGPEVDTEEWHAQQNLSAMNQMVIQRRNKATKQDYRFGKRIDPWN